MYNNKKIIELNKDFDYLFEIIRGDFNLSYDIDGSIVILRLLYTRLKSMNQNNYRGLWKDISHGVRNISSWSDERYLVEQFLVQLSHSVAVEFSGNNFSEKKLNSILKSQTIHTIVEIIRLLDSTHFEEILENSSEVAEFFYRFVLKLLRLNKYIDDRDIDESITGILSRIANIKDGDKIFDPFIGIGRLMFSSIANLDNMRIDISGQDIDISLIEISNMLFNLLNTYEVNIKHNNNLLEFRDNQDIFHSRFNKIITQIPYNIKLNNSFSYKPFRSSSRSFIEYTSINLKNANYLYILNIIDMLDYNGQAFIVAPNSILYSGGKEGEIRKAIIRNDLIDTIIEFSEYRSFRNSIKPIMLVLNKRKESYRKNKIHLINVINNDIAEVIKAYNSYSESDISRIISVDTIANRDYNLNFSHYDPIFDEVKLMLVQDIGISLNNIVNIVKPSAYKFKPFVTKGIPLVKQSNLKRDLDDVFLKSSELENCEYIEPANQHNGIVSEKALIISLQGKDLKPTIFDPQKTGIENVALAQNCLALIPRHDVRDTINIDYLYYQLYNPRVIRQIDGYKRGAFYKRITYKDFLNVIISKPEYEKQLQLIKVQEEPLKELEKYKRLYEEESLKIEVEKVKAENRAVNMLIHNVSKHISVIGHDIQIITKVLQEHKLINYIYDLEEIEKFNSTVEVLNGLQKKKELVTIKEVLDRTVERLDLVEKTFTDTQKTVNLNLEPEDFKKINVKELIKEIKRDRDLSQPINYDFIVEGDEAFLDINEQSFKEMIHILINNAEEHAFNMTDSVSNNYFIKFNIKKYKDKVTIEYLNNGLKFNMDKEDFILAGRKAKNSSGSGLGGAYLYRVIISHNGSFEIKNLDIGTKFILNFQTKR